MNPLRNQKQIQMEPYKIAKELTYKIEMEPYRIVRKLLYKIVREPYKKTDTTDCKIDCLLEMRDKPFKSRDFFGNILLFTGNYCKELWPELEYFFQSKIESLADLQNYRVCWDSIGSLFMRAYSLLIDLVEREGVDSDFFDSRCKDPVNN